MSHARTSAIAAVMFGALIAFGMAVLARWIPTNDQSNPQHSLNRRDTTGIGVDQGRDAPSSRARAQALWARLPLGFEANRGQLDQTVRYFARGDGFDLFLTANEAVFASTPAVSSRAPLTMPAERPSLNPEHSIVRMQFVNATRVVQAVGVDALPGRTNYLIGSQERWTRGVPSYRAVRYSGVWNGIDVVFHGRRDVIEYDFEVRAGAQVETIQFALTGADQLEIDGDGNLIVTANGRRHTHRAPKVFQLGEDRRMDLPGRFVLRGGDRVGFEVDGRDSSLPIVVDPEVVYLTDFFGGPDNDNVFSIDVNRDGSAIIAGYTLSPTWPGTGPSSLQDVNQAGEPFRAAGLVAKLAPDGSHLEWTTFLAGTGDDNKIWKVVVDERGFALVCGATNSVDFPTTDNAHSRVHGGGYFDAFLSVLNLQGAELVYSSYFGGEGDEFFFGCTIQQEPEGRGRGRQLLVGVGYTWSPDYPKMNAADTLIDGSIDPVVTVVDPTGGGIVYSSLLPGSVADDIAEDVEARGEWLAIAGRTFGGPRPPQTFWHHAVEDGRGVAQLSASPTFWATPPGYGNNWVQRLTKGFALPSGLVRADLVARWETEENFDFLRLRVSADGGTTWDVLAERHGFSAGFEALSVDLSAYAGTSVLIQVEFFSDTFGSDEDGFIDTNGSAVDSVSITGHPTDDFETDLDGWVASDGATFFQAAVSHGPTGFNDAFIAVVNPFAPGGSMRVAALGGRGFDEAYGIEWSPDGTVVVAGITATVSYPTTPGAFQPTRPGLQNLFVARLSADLSTLIASTYLGSTQSEFLNGLAVDAAGRPIVTGFSTASTYPLVDPLDLSPPFGAGGSRDYILTILSADLTRLDHSSMFGDAGWELGAEVAIGPDGDIYALGRHRTGLQASGASTQIFVLRVRP